MNRALAIACLLLANAWLCVGQERSKWRVRVDVQMIAVPAAEALVLLPRLRDPTTFAAAEQEVRTMLSTGAAELVDAPQALCESNQKATVDSILEARYPAEFDIGGCPFPDSRSPFVKSITGEHSVNIPAVRLSHPFYVPSTFDTRNVGSSLEIEPVVNAKGDIIDLSLFVQLLRFRGIENTIGGRPGPPTSIGYPMARFAIFKIQSGFSISNGGGALVGTFTMPEPKPRLLLFLLHASAKPSPK